MQTERDTRWYRLLLAAALIVISYLAVTSRTFPVVRSMNDKVDHALAFFTLAMLVDFSWPGSGFRAPKVLTLLAYGLAIEIVQYFLRYRTCSFFDLMADGVGMLLFWLAIPLLRKMAPFRKRWQN